MRLHFSALFPHYARKIALLFTAMMTVMVIIIILLVRYVCDFLFMMIGILLYSRTPPSVHPYKYDIHSSRVDRENNFCAKRTTTTLRQKATFHWSGHHTNRISLLVGWLVGWMEYTYITYILNEKRAKLTAASKHSSKYYTVCSTWLYRTSVDSGSTEELPAKWLWASELASGFGGAGG